MENAISKVLKKDIEAQEKMNSLGNLGEESQVRIEEKKAQIKKEIWDSAHQFVKDEKEKLQKDLSEGEVLNKKQSDEILEQLETKFKTGRADWEKELFEKVVALEKSDSV